MPGVADGSLFGLIDGGRGEDFHNPENAIDEDRKARRPRAARGTKGGQAKDSKILLHQRTKNHQFIVYLTW